MTVYFQKRWPVQNLSAVCATQNMAANIPALLNGTFADPYNANTISFITHGFSRVVSITSTNNLAAVNFTVVGTQNGVAVSEVIAGPNATTVYGTHAFDGVSSVTPSANANGVSIGTGRIGYLPLVVINNSRLNYISWSLGVTVPLNPAPGITYQGYLTLDDIGNSRITFDNLITSGLIYDHVFTDDTASQTLSVIGVRAKYALIQISASTTPTTDTLIMSFLQN